MICHNFLWVTILKIYGSNIMFKISNLSFQDEAVVPKKDEIKQDIVRIRMTIKERKLL